MRLHNCTLANRLFVSHRFVVPLVHWTAINWIARSPFIQWLQSPSCIAQWQIAPLHFARLHNVYSSEAPYNISGSPHSGLRNRTMFDSRMLVWRIAQHLFSWQENRCLTNRGISVLLDVEQLLRYSSNRCLAFRMTAVQLFARWRFSF